MAGVSTERTEGAFRNRFEGVRATIKKRMSEVAGLERVSPAQAEAQIAQAEERLRQQIEVHARERHATVEGAQQRLEEVSERFVADLSRLRGELEGIEAELMAGARSARDRLADEAEELARAAIERRAEEAGRSLEQQVGELTADVRGELERQVEKLSPKARRQELKLARQERDRRVQAAEHRLLELAARLHAEIERTREDNAAQLRDAGWQGVQEALAAQRSELAADLQLLARTAISAGLDHAETRLSAAAAAAEQEARSRIAEATKTARFRIEAADRAQERELKVREATQRAEREMAARVRDAEERLLAVLDELATAEGWLRDAETREEPPAKPSPP